MCCRLAFDYYGVDLFGKPLVQQEAMTTDDIIFKLVEIIFIALFILICCATHLLGFSEIVCMANICE